MSNSIISPSNKTSISVPKSTRGMIFNKASSMSTTLPNASCRLPYLVSPSTSPTKPPVIPFIFFNPVKFSIVQSSTTTLPLILPAKPPVANTVGSVLGLSNASSILPKFPSNASVKPPTRSRIRASNPSLSFSISFVLFSTLTFLSLIFFTVTCSASSFVVKLDLLEIVPKKPTPDCSLILIALF